MLTVEKNVLKFWDNITNTSSIFTIYFALLFFFNIQLNFEAEQSCSSEQKNFYVLDLKVPITFLLYMHNKSAHSFDCQMPEVCSDLFVTHHEMIALNK